MSRKLFAKTSQRKFLKLSSNLSRSFCRTAKQSRTMQKSSVHSKSLNGHSVKWPKFHTKLNLFKHVNSVRPSHKTDKTNCNSRPHYSHQDAKNKIESLLLERWHELFTPLTLSRNDIEKLVKQAALEIACDLKVDRKKFKCTKSWLRTFLKKCELLGYFANSSNVVEKETPSREADNGDCDFTSGSTLTSSASLCSSVNKDGEQLPVPNLLHLFASPQNGIEAVSDETTLNCETPVKLHSQPVVLISGDHQESNRNASFSPPRKRPSRKTIVPRILYRKNDDWMNFSSIIPTSALSPSLTGFQLIRNDEDIPEFCDTQYSSSVLDELYHVFSKSTNAADSISQRPTCSIDSVESGYKSWSGSQSYDELETVNSIQPSPVITLPQVVKDTHRHQRGAIKRNMETCAAHNSTAIDDQLSSFADDPLMNLFSTNLNNVDVEADASSSHSHSETKEETFDSADPLLNLFTSPGGNVDKGEENMLNIDSLFSHLQDDGHLTEVDDSWLGSIFL